MVILNGNDLNIREVAAVSRFKEKVEIEKKSIEKVKQCSYLIDEFIEQDRVVYGITTGFGDFAKIKISKENVEELQKNLIMSHASGVGELLMMKL